MYTKNYICKNLIMISTKISSFNIIVFGGTGDLAKRKIYPAFYQRFCEKQLDCDFNIFIIHRKKIDIIKFTDEIIEFIELNSIHNIDTKITNDFKKRIKFIQLKDHTTKEYLKLSKVLNENKKNQDIFYLSTPSQAFGPICQTLKESNLINNNSKVVLEKPLGTDLKSSIEINNKIVKSFNESQIYRIDHYLGKETVQNLMVLRFANHLFERSWSSEDIEYVTITVSESLGVENRADYYEKSGALLDMVQNHLLQLLCLIAMEPPNKLNANSVRDEKVKVLKSLRFFNTNNIDDHSVKGQYTRGKISNTITDEFSIPSYLEDIDKFESDTETFVALKTYVDNWRWSDTPFYLRTGKRMKKRYSEIIINFKPVKHNLFTDQGKIEGNNLVIRLQPEERIELLQMTKIPGPGGYRYKPISLKLDFIDSFNERLPEAYERLIIDIIRGQQTLFMRQDELEAAWKWIESITNSWNNKKTKNILYEAGTWGPGDFILEKNHKWTKLKHESS